jgi:hypothetical protein
MVACMAGVALPLLGISKVLTDKGITHDRYD